MNLCTRNKQTTGIGQDGAAALIACPTLLHGLLTCSKTLPYHTKEAYKLAYTTQHTSQTLHAHQCGKKPLESAGKGMSGSSLTICDNLLISPNIRRNKLYNQSKKLPYLSGNIGRTCKHYNTTKANLFFSRQQSDIYVLFTPDARYHDLPRTRLHVPWGMNKLHRPNPQRVRIARVRGKSRRRLKGFNGCGSHF